MNEVIMNEALQKEKFIPIEFTVNSDMYGVTKCIIDSLERTLKTGKAPCADGSDHHLSHHELEQLRNGATYATFTSTWSLPEPACYLGVLVPDGERLEFPKYSLDAETFKAIKRELRKSDFEYVDNGYNTGIDAKDAYDKLLSGDYENKKKFQAFWTTDAIAKMMVNLAELQPGLKILEPSAGNGALIRAIRAKSPKSKIHAFEIQTRLRGFLDENFDDLVLGDDFLNHSVLNKYDRIIANPPFTKDQDVEHITKMVKHLRSGGILVALSSQSWHTERNNKQKEFKRMLNLMGARTIDLPKGTFKESGTMVATTVIIIKKK